MGKKIEGIKLTAEILAIAISLISLGIAWQANQISQSANQSQIIVLSATHIEDKIDIRNNFEVAKCRTRIRLANVGGIDTTLYSILLSTGNADSSQDIVVSDIPKNINVGSVLENTIGYALAFNDNPPELTIHDFVTGDPKDIKSDLPIDLKAHSTTDVFVDLDITDTEDKYSFKSTTLQPTEVMTFSKSSYNEINVTYKLSFPNTEMSVTDPTLCIYYQ